jgi:hypothetical protein
MVFTLMQHKQKGLWAEKRVIISDAVREVVIKQE